MCWCIINTSFLIKYYYAKKEIRFIFVNNKNKCDFFFFKYEQNKLIFTNGCRSPPSSQRNEFDRHIEHLQLTECQINIRAVHKAPSMEEMLLEKEGEREIIRKIWDLPIPQNRRVYMFIVDEFSLTEIARIEKRDVSVIKRSVDAGIRKLQKNLKNF